MVMNNAPNPGGAVNRGGGLGGSAPMQLPTNLPSQIKYNLPEKGMVSQLGRTVTDIQPLGLKTLSIAHDVGGQTIQFRFPTRDNLYIDFATLRFKANVEVKGAHNRGIDPNCGLAGAIEKIVISSQGTIIEEVREANYIAAFFSMITQNPASQTSQQFYLTGVGGGNNQQVVDHAAVTSVVAPLASTTPLTRAVTARAPRVTPYSIPFLASGFVKNPYFIPSSVLPDLMIELTFARGNDFVCMGHDGTNAPSFSSVDFSNIRLSVDFVSLPQAVNLELNQALQGGKKIPVHFMPTRIIKSSFTLPASQTMTETVNITETLSSVKSMFVCYYHPAVRDNRLYSNFALAEPGALSDATGNITGGFKSFQVQNMGNVVPELPISERASLLQYVTYAHTDRMDGLLNISGLSGNAQEMEGGEFCGAFTFANDATESFAAIAAGNFYQYMGGKFHLGMRLKQYSAGFDEMNGVPLDHNLDVHTTFENGSGFALNYTRRVFLRYDRLMEVGKQSISLRE